MLQSLLNKIAGLRAGTLTQVGIFAKLAKLLRTPIFTEKLRRLLLVKENVLTFGYSRVL